MYYIYSLTDPFDLKIKYIGVTNNPENRSKNYRADKTFYNKSLQKWINDLHESGNVVRFTVIKSFSIKKIAFGIEASLIKKIQPEFNIKSK